MDPLTEWTDRLGWILPVWLFAVGGTIGSFLNVVVYRLPAGKSIVHPGSHCPKCGHAIRWYHNLPILSWILLGGRCHDCHAKISPRYPIVELETAVLFVAVFLFDVWRPMHPNSFNDVASPVLPSGIDLYSHYVVDLWLLCSLLAAALIELDGERVPQRILWLVCLIGLAAAAALPFARSALDLKTAPFALVGAPRLNGLLNAVAGLLAGGIVGLVLKTSSLRRLMVGRDQATNGPSGAEALALGMAAMGACLGWLAALVVGVAATIALIIVRKMCRPTSPIQWFGWSTYALLAALAWITLAADQFN